VYLSTTGAKWTNNNGQTWNNLLVNGGAYASRYYPNSVQTPDGWIYVFGHNGADNYYGQVDQFVWMDKFRLVTQTVPASGAGSESGQLLASEPSQPNVLFFDVEPSFASRTQLSRAAVTSTSGQSANDDLLNVLSATGAAHNSSLADADHDAAIDEAISGDAFWLRQRGLSSALQVLLAIAELDPSAA
jgi:hypothetical protein